MLEAEIEDYLKDIGRLRKALRSLLKENGEMHDDDQY
jgi:hypothetical protein